MEKYKELLKKIIQLRYFDSCAIHNITDIRFESNGIRVDYSYSFLEDERAIRGEVIYNSELNAYMFDNFIDSFHKSEKFEQIDFNKLKNLKNGNIFNT